MKTAADLETARAAAVASTEASNVWRKGNTYNYAQGEGETPDSGDDTTHGYSVHANDGHNAVLTRSANLETARVAAVAHQADIDAWRAGNTYKYALG